MSEEFAERVAKLPAWAREHVKYLETRSAPLVEEVARMRRKVDELNATVRRKNDQIDAMVEMFKCAAKGGNEVAAAVQRIVEDFLRVGD
jgi:uncharacterized coiled-coil DUF342 family protein